MSRHQPTLLSLKEDIKTCGRCREVKAYSEFTKSKATLDGLFNYCKLCRKTYRDNEKEKEYQRRRHITRAYGITTDEYNKMWRLQKGLCSICGRSAKETSSKGDRLHVDHCHETGVVRGLLCSPCNHGLGHFGDDISRLANAISYLNKNE